MTSPSWGDLNARLNELVRKGVISGFRTNRASDPHAAFLAIVVTPGSAALPRVPGVSDAAALRARIALALADVAPQVAITVEAAVPPDPSG